MDTPKHIQCSCCKHSRPISDFYKQQPPDSTTKVLKMCARCRSNSTSSRRSKKRSPQNFEPATSPPAKRLRDVAPASSNSSHRAGDRKPGRIVKQVQDKRLRDISPAS